jgi:hypothetical protein
VAARNAPDRTFAITMQGTRSMLKRVRENDDATQALAETLLIHPSWRLLTYGHRDRDWHTVRHTMHIQNSGFRLIFERAANLRNVTR